MCRRAWRGTTRSPRRRLPRRITPLAWRGGSYIFDRDKRLACLAPPNTRQSAGPVFSATVAKCVLDSAVFRPAPTGLGAPITGAYGSGAGFPGAGFWPFEPPGGPIVMALRRVAIVCLLLKCRILAIKRLIIKNTPRTAFGPGVL